MDAAVTHAQDRIRRAVRRPLARVGDAQSLLADCAVVGPHEPDLARAGAGHARAFLRPLMAKMSASVGGPGAPLSLPQAHVCRVALTEIDAVADRAGVLGGPLWSRPEQALRAAAEHFAILNGEQAADRKPLHVEELYGLTLTVMEARVPVTLEAPRAKAFALAPGTVGVTQMAAGRRPVLTLVLPSPFAPYELNRLTAGASFLLGLSGGPSNFRGGLNAMEDAARLEPDTFVLYVAVREDRAVFPLRRRAVTRFRRVVARVITRRADRLQARAVAVSVVDDLPQATPVSVRSAVAEALRAAARQPATRCDLPADFPLAEALGAVEAARLSKAARIDGFSARMVRRTAGGVVEPLGFCLQMATRLPGGRLTSPAMSVVHLVYEYPAEVAKGHARVVIDGTAARFTDYVRGSDGRVALVPLAKLRQEGLLEAVQSGIFSRNQHHRFCRLVDLVIGGPSPG